MMYPWRSDSYGLAIVVAFAVAVAVCRPGAAAWRREPLRLDGPVSIAQGRLQGVRGKASTVTAFRAIPYAAPPTGHLRWRAPQPASPWQGVRLADRFAASCPQSQQADQLSLTA